LDHLECNDEGLIWVGGIGDVGQCEVDAEPWRAWVGWLHLILQVFVLEQGLEGIMIETKVDVLLHEFNNR
jgi:hypothetical protein